MFIRVHLWTNTLEINLIQFTEKADDLIFTVRVVPRASKSEIIGEHDGALKVRIHAPPVEGAANAELIKVLAKQFGVAKSAVEITGGYASKQKQVRVGGMSGAKFLNLIERPVNDSAQQRVAKP